MTLPWHCIGKYQVAPTAPNECQAHEHEACVCVLWGLHQLQVGAQCRMPAHNSRFEACVASLQWPALIGYRACMICAYALVARGDANPLCRICMASHEAAGHRSVASTSAIRCADHSAHATLVSTMARPRCAVKQESTTWSLPCWHVVAHVSLAHCVRQPTAHPPCARCCCRCNALHYRWQSRTFAWCRHHTGSHCRQRALRNRAGDPHTTPP